MQRRTVGLATVGLLLCLAPPLSPAFAAQKGMMPTIDGEAGPCSLELTAVDVDGEPVYGADIQVHIDYGLFGLRKLDLEAGTDADGKARFEGLPDEPHDALYFEAFTGKLRGVAVFDPRAECHGEHVVLMAER